MSTPPADLSRHPCFNPAAAARYGRIHLPVAPKCNVQCNYCNRKYDCANESRPGVTSAVLSPGQALKYLDEVLEREPRITVVGIAGPGDPFANPNETLQTLRLVREKYPEMLLCVSSNGLGIAPYVDDLAEIGVSHVTITINAVDPAIGKEVYAWVRDGRMLYRGRVAAELLLRKQLAAVQALKAKGITVKVNSILIPGLNDEHIPVVAARLKELGADLLNCVPLFPTAETVFEEKEEPDAGMVFRVRALAEKHLPQMRHCMRCRADAVGLLCHSRTDEFRPLLTAASLMPLNPQHERPYVAVASMEGVLVNLHLGDAQEFRVYAPEGEGFRQLPPRPAPPKGGGASRWAAMAEVLHDCRAVLVSAAGETPKEALKKEGVRVVEMEGLIQEGLAAIYRGDDMRIFARPRTTAGCGARAGTGCG